MNFNWELSDFCVTSRNKCHVSSDDYLFQVFTLNPRIVKVEQKDLQGPNYSLGLLKGFEFVGMK